MRKPKSRKPRVEGRYAHTYRVVVEKVAHQSMYVMATSQDDAGSRACDFARRHPENWVDEGSAVRGRASVLMTDGSWRSCDALDADPGVMVQYGPESPSRAE